jgi:hypothetical protein
MNCYVVDHIAGNRLLHGTKLPLRTNRAIC